MLDALTSIIGAIQSAIQFLFNTINSMVDFISNIPQYVNFLTTSFTLIPSVILPFAVASVTTYVVLLLIDRR